MSRTRRALAGFDGLEPGGAVAAGDARQQLLEHFAQIADEGNIDLDVLVDLGGIDLDVNLLGLGGVGREVPVTRSSKRMPQAISRSAS
jgi:hypothetical protein